MRFSYLLDLIRGTPCSDQRVVEKTPDLLKIYIDKSMQSKVIILMMISTMISNENTFMMQKYILIVKLYANNSRYIHIILNKMQLFALAFEIIVNIFLY